MLRLLVSCFLYLLFTLVLDSLYHRLISMPPEMSMASPPWNSALALRPDCRWMTWSRTHDLRGSVSKAFHHTHVPHLTNDIVASQRSDLLFYIRN